MAADRIQGRVFGEVADEYDRLRPGYPAEVIDDVLTYAGSAKPSVLEIGAGTGKATMALAQRGLTITAVEPDPAMAEILEARCVNQPVRVVVSSFEDYRPTEQFGLLVSATAFHWTNPATRWQLSAAALAPGGALALFWNNDRIADAARARSALGVLRQLPDDAVQAMTPQSRAAWSAHCAHAARLVDKPEPWEGGVGHSTWPPSELPTRPEFDDVTERVYRWSRVLTAADYLAYQLTQSSYRLLPDQVRGRMLDSLADVVGDPVVLDGNTVLVLARRR